MSDNDSINPRSLPKQGRSAETVKAILQAAARVLESMKLDQSSTNQIAKIAGVGIGTLYQYFPNKESLAAMLIDHEMEKNVTTFENIFAEMRQCPVSELLRRITAETATFFKRRTFLRAIYEHVPQFGKIERVMRGREKLVTALARELEQRKVELQPLNFEHAAFMLIHSIGGLLIAVVFADPMPMNSDEFEIEVNHLISRYVLRS